MEGYKCAFVPVIPALALCYPFFFNLQHHLQQQMHLREFAGSTHCDSVWVELSARLSGALVTQMSVGPSHLRNVLHPSSSAWPLCFSAQCRGVLRTLGLSLTLVLTQPLLWAEVMHPLLHMCFKLLQDLIHQWATSLKVEQEVVLSMPFLRRLRCEVDLLCASTLTCQVYVLYRFQGQTCIYYTGSNLQKWKREKVRSFLSMETSICNICVCVCFGWKCLTYLVEKIAVEIKSFPFPSVIRKVIQRYSL